VHRFFLPPDCFDEDDVSITDPELIHQLSRVLRCGKGDQVVCLDGLGSECVTELLTFAKDEITGQVISRQPSKAEPPVFITLYQALPKKPSLFEEVLQHGTEVGISRFVPLLSARTEMQSVKNTERAARILREAAEQSERGIVPELVEVVSFEATIQNPPDGLNIIADSYCSEPLLGELFTDRRKKPLINIFVGPEGGFAESEIAAATAAGWKNFSLGPRILRTETAGVAIVSTILFR